MRTSFSDDSRTHLLWDELFITLNTLDHFVTFDIGVLIRSMALCAQSHSGVSKSMTIRLEKISYLNK